MNRRVVPTILALALGLAGCGAASVADTNPSTSAVASQTSAAANPTTTSSAENLELPDFLAATRARMPTRTTANTIWPNPPRSPSAVRM